MDLIPSISTLTTTATSSGPAPFLLKTYEMVDDSSTDEIVSWSSENNSFVVWNPLEFARLLLPTYFKHNNFSSFIRQLNTYGFHKIDPERWEFHNDDFMKDNKQLLRNIHRRKPIHSHSHPPPDPERSAFEEEIEKLKREKNELESNVTSFRLQEGLAKTHLQDIRQRLSGLDQRQDTLLTLLQKSVQDPGFVECLAKKIEGMDLSAYNKKRRLPRTDNIIPIVDNSSKQDISDIYQQDMCNELNLELSTAVPNIISNNVHGSNGDWVSAPKKLSVGEFKDADMEIHKETVDGTCPLSEKFGSNELHSVRQSIVLSEGEKQICCQLNLSLAFSSIQADQDASPARVTQMDPDLGGSVETGNNVDEIRTSSTDNIPPNNTGNAPSSQETCKNNQVSTPAVVPRVNDLFWEQFLTERPGSSDAEEASSSYRGLPHDEQEERGSSRGMSRTAKNLGKLTL